MSAGFRLHRALGALVVSGFLVVGGVWVGLWANHRSPRFAALQAQVAAEHKVILHASSSDGLRWTVTDRTPFRGSTPELTELDSGFDVIFWRGSDEGELVHWAEGQRTPRLVFEDRCGLDMGAQCVDPDVVALPGGGFRMFWVEASGLADPAGPDQDNTIRSATSPDGLTWTPEDGARLRGPFVDPDVVALPEGGFRMYLTRLLPRERLGPEDPHMAIVSARSVDGLAFRLEDGSRIPGGNASSTVHLPNGRVRTYFHTRPVFFPQEPRDPTAVIRSAVSSNGLDFEVEVGDRIALPAGTRGRLMGAEAPGVVAHPGGGLHMTFASVEEPRFPWNLLEVAGAKDPPPAVEVPPLLR